MILNNILDDVLYFIGKFCAAESSVTFFGILFVSLSICVSLCPFILLRLLFFRLCLSFMFLFLLLHSPLS